MKPQAVHTREDVEDVTLTVLADGSIKTAFEITSAVKARSNLTPADKARAAKRPNESKIDHIIAHALQNPRRLCSDRLLLRVAGGAFRIAPMGSAYLVRQQAKVEEGITTLNAMFPEESWD